MPENKSAVIRYRIIDQMLTNKCRPYPTLEQLAAKCTAVLGSDASTSTIEKDIRAMSEQAPKSYSAPIVYSKLEGGYVYSEVGFSIAELNLNKEEWTALQFAAELLYLYKEVSVFSKFKMLLSAHNPLFSKIANKVLINSLWIPGFGLRSSSFHKKVKGNCFLVHDMWF